MSETKESSYVTEALIAEDIDAYLAVSYTHLIQHFNLACFEVHRLNSA